MPIYQCSYQRGLLNEDTKAKVASAITDAHVEVTGAPRIFVHTFFNELPPGISFSADGPDLKISGITGQIRAGRSLEERQKLVKRIVASWTQLTGQPQKTGHRRRDRDRIRDPDGVRADTPAPRQTNPNGSLRMLDALDGIQGTGL